MHHHHPTAGFTVCGSRLTLRPYESHARNGEVIAGRYRLTEPIGRGGMGTVWKATDLELRRVVALKAGDSEPVHREARIGAGLRHPNVITVFDVVVDDGSAGS